VAIALHEKEKRLREKNREGSELARALALLWRKYAGNTSIEIPSPHVYRTGRGTQENPSEPLTTGSPTTNPGSPHYSHL
jgi:hypothetical protein